MSENNFGPYRATALWNEAVLMFKDGIKLKENRHRLHKHKNSFTGRDAVTFLHEALLTNNLFKADITRKQTHQLLNHFFKADLVQQVKNCPMRVADCFQDSSKYFYEFTEVLVNFEVSIPGESKFNPDQSKERSSLKNNNVSENECRESMVVKTTSSKSDIIQRIEKLLQIMELHEDISRYLIICEVDSNWVNVNSCPKWVNVRWNTNLPHWVLGAIKNFLRSTVPKNEEMAFPQFGLELFKIIVNYFDTLESPLISPMYNKLICAVFNQLNHLNEKKMLRRYNSLSQEHLLLDISMPSCEEDVMELDKCLSNDLPPYSCYEAAFTSDHPVTRIVPQSSFDTIHLKKKIRKHLGGNQVFPQMLNPLKSSCSLKDIHLMPTALNVGMNSRRRPLQIMQPNGISSNPPVYQKNGKPSYNKGFVNEGFTPIPSERDNKCEKNGHFASWDKTSYWNEVRRKSKSYDDIDTHAYVNHGLTCSFDENVETDCKLDYVYAIESVNRLVEASQPKRKSFSSDDDQSFHSACSHSLVDTSEKTSYSCDKEATDSRKNMWSQSVVKLGVSMFQLIFMLLPPNNRAQLRLIIMAMNHVSASTRFEELSFQNMLHKMRHCILKLDSKTVQDELLADKIIAFIAVNTELIFTDLPDLVPADLPNSISAKSLNDNYAQRYSFCEQISKDKFLEQKAKQSSLALSQLIEQIMQNDHLPKNEQKKYLKKFKDLYPVIYDQHCSKVTCGVKNLRV